MRLVTTGVSMLCAGFFLAGMSLSLFSGSDSTFGVIFPLLAFVFSLAGYLLARPALKASKAARQRTKQVSVSNQTEPAHAEHAAE